MDAKYRRMLKLMQEKEIASSETKECLWSLYILKCRDGSLYTGVTNNLDRRLKAHEEGRASKFTRVRRPIQLLYQENCGSRTQALLRELEVKSWPRKKKEELVGRGPEPEDLRGGAPERRFPKTLNQSP